MDNVDSRLTQFELLMRTSTVPRWSVITMMKEQSVAEHSFNVMVLARTLALRITHDLRGFEFPPIDMAYLLELALLHDAHESETGDLPIPFKKRLKHILNGLEKTAPSTQTLSEQVFHELFEEPTLRHDRTLENALVSVADIMDAIIHVDRYMLKRSTEMVNYLKIEMHDRLQKIEDEAIRHRLWHIAMEMIHTAVNLP